MANITKLERLTTDTPQNNLETMLNYAYAKEDRNVYLRYGDGEENIELCKYLASVAVNEIGCGGCLEEAIRDDGCSGMDCDCIVAMLYTIAGQAAELRARLKMYEDLAEQGRLTDLPCDVGDIVYITGEKYPCEITEVIIDECGIHFNWISYKKSYDLTEFWHDGDFSVDDINKTVFLTKEQAEKTLEEKK